MSTLDSSSAPQNSTASNGNLPAIQFLPHHPPNDLMGYHQQPSSMGHIPPSSHVMQQPPPPPPPAAYIPQPGAYPPPGAHHTTQPAQYDPYGPPPPAQHMTYSVPHFTHSHPPSPYTHHFPSDYHQDPFTYTSGASFRNYVTDPSGQSGPPGMKPRVTTTLWEDEGTLCFQVEAKGICVARREGMFLSLPFLHIIFDF
jgi:enhanced filamentous growth protein 1